MNGSFPARVFAKGVSHRLRALGGEVEGLVPLVGLVDQHDLLPVLQGLRQLEAHEGALQDIFGEEEEEDLSGADDGLDDLLGDDEEEEAA